MSAVQGVFKPDIELATALFAQLREATADGAGVTRASYSREENLAHELVRQAALGLGLAVRADYAGNLYMVLSGKDLEAKPFVIGSHLDSVKCGGNFDGAAGVLAGLAIASAYRRAGRIPDRDLIVMAIRAEESMWFSCSYLGSRAALGLLEPELLHRVRRVDTQRTLADHVAECGFDVSRYGDVQELRPDRLGAFIEIHIEQGPVLEQKGIAVGIVTGIRGSFRYRAAMCRGEYGHCGTVPRTARRDAVSSVADFICSLNAAWESLENSGHDLAVTVGMVETDRDVHAVSKIAGEVKFALDVRSQSVDTMKDMRKIVADVVRQIEIRRNVVFDLGSIAEAPPALMDAGLQQKLRRAAQGLGIPYVDLPSGAGHDAAMFASAGVPTAMIFIRNGHGSHNPRESMNIEDFASAAAVVLEMIENAASFV